MRLNLRCGEKLRAGWLNVDIRPLHPSGAEFLCADLRDLDGRVADRSVSEIAAENVLEFLSWRDLDAALCLLGQKLRPGGGICVQVPDLEAVVRGNLDNPVPFLFVERALYGAQAHGEDAHRSAWTAVMLCQRLGMMGLTVQRIEDIRGQLWARAIREED